MHCHRFLCDTFTIFVSPVILLAGSFFLLSIADCKKHTHLNEKVLCHSGAFVEHDLIKTKHIVTWLDDLYSLGQFYHFILYSRVYRSIDFESFLKQFIFSTKSVVASSKQISRISFLILFAHV